jgi:GNAT superfamily N-acetyltransferase
MASDTPSAPDRAHALAPLGGAERGRVALRLPDDTPVWLRTSCAGTPEEHAAIVAEAAGGRAVGRADYRRVYGSRAVLTLTIDDELRAAGLAQALLGAISDVAAAAGISKLLLRVPRSDEALLGVLVDEFAARFRRAMSYVEVELDAGAARQG